MKSMSWMLLVGLLVGIGGGPSGCRRSAASFWCREDNRECFASKKECATRLGSWERLACFAQEEAYCFRVVGDLLQKATGKRLCLPSAEECLDWRQDRAENRPSLAVGPCVTANGTRR
ncbi:MAG: hypothetical protein HY903_18445 [Deltaproteobacteria bacterium]|nr:hypothetical protein [Deltaproteobacteria bacterium]